MSYKKLSECPAAPSQVCTVNLYVASDQDEPQPVLLICCFLSFTFEWLLQRFFFFLIFREVSTFFLHNIKLISFMWAYRLCYVNPHYVQGTLLYWVSAHTQHTACPPLCTTSNFICIFNFINEFWKIELITMHCLVAIYSTDYRKEMQLPWFCST